MSTRARPKPAPARRSRSDSSLFTVIRLAALLPLAALALAAWLGWLPRQLAMLYAAISTVTFLLYAYDKSAARAGRWRVRESTLHVWSLAGGWPGALAAQQWLRHKSSKSGFAILFWLCTGANCAGLYWVLRVSA